MYKKFEKYKHMFKREHHTELAEFSKMNQVAETNDDDSLYEEIFERFWNDGSLQDKSRSVLILCAKGDDIYYCWKNGYVNTTGLCKDFLDLPLDEVLEAIEAYCDDFCLRQ